MKNLRRRDEFNATWGIPSDQKLPLFYDMHEPSPVILNLKSEQGRRIFAERLIRNPRLGPLTDLCIRALAKKYAPKDMLKTILTDPLQSRIYYDELSVDLPLDESIQINDQKYWHRVCLAKSTHTALLLQDVSNWKKLGIALKLAELLQNTPAEFFDEDEMAVLAKKIKKYVFELHIRYLQCLTDHTFKLNYVTDSEEESEVGETSSDDELFGRSSKISVLSARYGRTKEEEEWQNEERMRRNARITERRTMKENKLYRKMQREKRKATKRGEEPIYIGSSVAPSKTSVRLPTLVETARESKVKRASTKSVKSQKGKRKRKKKTLSEIFETEVEPEIDDTIDVRNKSAYYEERTQRNRYPTDQCHHLPLSFIGHFSNLESFILEFKAPELTRNYHTKYFNFSYMDILQLAHGISNLPRLKVFRLRNSRMNAKKLYSLSTALVKLEELEVLDFGFDQLKDDCDEAISLLLKINSLKSIELESNAISTKVFKALADGIRYFKGNLEYLGLARNAIEVKAMRLLCRDMNSNQQVVHLCLNGASISQKSIAACIARELIQFSDTLRNIEMTGLRIGPKAAIELVSALRDNQLVLNCDIRGCGVPMDIECDIKILCQRNEYIRQNPYIEDVSRSQSAIEKFVDNKKHPIHTCAINNVKKLVEQHTTFVTRFSHKADYPTPRPTIIALPPRIPAKRSRSGKIAGSISTVSKTTKYDSDLTHEKLSLGVPSTTTIVSEELFYTHIPHYILSESVASEPFEYEPNDFDVDMFHRHVFVPGHEDRYFFFKAKSLSLSKIA